MDDPTVSWSKDRYDGIVPLMGPCLKKSGYSVKKDVQSLPVSGLTGWNMKSQIEPGVCPWWEGPSLFEALDATEVTNGDPEAPLRMPISLPSKDSLPEGKVECGSIHEGDNLLMMPNKAPVKVLALYRGDEEDTIRVSHSGPGENLLVKHSGIGEEALKGCVLSSVERPIRVTSEFVARLQILNVPDNRLFCAGLQAKLHFPHVEEACVVAELMQEIVQTGKLMKKKPKFVRSNAVVVCRIEVANQICVKKYSDFAQFGRFSLRDVEKMTTLAFGIVTDFPALG